MDTLFDNGGDDGVVPIRPQRNTGRLVLPDEPRPSYHYGLVGQTSPPPTSPPMQYAIFNPNEQYRPQSQLLMPTGGYPSNHTGSSSRPSTSNSAAPLRGDDPYGPASARPLSANSTNSMMSAHARQMSGSQPMHFNPYNDPSISGGSSGQDPFASLYVANPAAGDVALAQQGANMVHDTSFDSKKGAMPQQPSSQVLVHTDSEAAGPSLPPAPIPAMSAPLQPTPGAAPSQNLPDAPPPAYDGYGS